MNIFFKRLNQKTNLKEKADFVNQQLTLCYMNGDSSDWLTIFSNSETKKLVDITYKNGANFEYSFTSSAKDASDKFSHLLLWLELNNQIDKISSENINNCILSSTLSNQDKTIYTTNIRKNLKSIYENELLKNKINLSYSEYGIIKNLSNMKNNFMIDFLIKNHYKEILKDNNLHKNLESIGRKEFSIYLKQNCLSILLKNNQVNIKHLKKIKI